DYAYNLQGTERAQAAYNAAKTAGTVNGFPEDGGVQAIRSAQTHDIHAYQVGFALGNKDSLGLVYGTVSKKHAWELRTYWQHIEQYALDPNLHDSDFFEGRGNLEGIYTALAYGLSDNMIATIRYGYANRINNQLGTGGSNQDIPQMNPINQYHLLQLDLTFRF
ncbi:MAG: putative porin, partial [Verrucomicrobia bacterium]|nr:putative porin [Verrucomicrobiota bacterium]